MEVIIYQEMKYTIWVCSRPLPVPEEFGIRPAVYLDVPVTVRAYACTYHISDRGLVWKDLYITSANNRYPKINGVRAKKEYRATSECISERTYRDLDIFINYTGELLVKADGASYYKELKFSQGILCGTEDYIDTYSFYKSLPQDAVLRLLYGE